MRIPGKLITPPDDAAARLARAAERGTWPIRRFLTHDAPSPDLTATTSPAERLAMVQRLTLDAWAMSGRPLPSYGRADMPGRVIRPPAEPPSRDAAD